MVAAAGAVAATVLPSFSRNLRGRFTVTRTVGQSGQILTELGPKGTSRGDRDGYEDMVTIEVVSCGAWGQTTQLDCPALMPVLLEHTMLIPLWCYLLPGNCAASVPCLSD